MCDILQRIEVCFKILQDKENVDKSKIRRIRTIIKTSYDSCEDIYGREDPINFLKISSHKRDLLYIE